MTYNAVNKGRFMPFQPASEIQDYLVFGEYGEVNPSINDSATYTFMSPDTMKERFEHEIEGCFLYSRHWNPSNKYLSQALSAMENTESAQVTSSGMSAIACTLMQICGQGDEIIASRTIYGGTYALLKNFLPRMGITTHFVNLQDTEAVQAAINSNTRVIYGESMSNPLLEIIDISTLSNLAKPQGIKVVIDNTFSPMIISPSRLGADVVVHSLTKFINGTSDCVAGAICSSKDFINQLSDVNHGASMLLGPVLDSFRSASILKNLHSLHLRMQKHSTNAQQLAEALEEWGVSVHYPGLKNHPNHDLFSNIKHPDFGYGGMVVINTGDVKTANRFMEAMQNAKVGYLAVSLGYFKTLFSAPGNSTSSEIPASEREQMGLSDGMVRISVGLDHDIERSIQRIKSCLQEVSLL